MGEHKEIIKPELNVLNAVMCIPEARGGAVRAGLNLGNALSDYVSVDVVKMAGKYDDQLLTGLDLDINIHQLPTKEKIKRFGERFVYKNTNYWNSTIYTGYDSLPSFADYDLVHIHNPHPLAGMLQTAIKSRLNNTPYCVTTHGFRKTLKWRTFRNVSPVTSAVHKHIFTNALKWVIRNAEHIFVNSKADRRLINREFPDQSTTITPNGVQLSKYRSTKNKANGLEDVHNTKPSILFVGTIMESKGISDLLDGYDRMEEECQLLIVGPMKDNKFEEKISKYNEENVKYIGYIEHPDIISVYKEADIFIFPTRSDVFPIVNLEAMAAQTPVVSTEVGGIPNQFSNSQGVTVPPNNPAKIAEEVDELLRNDTRRTKMGQSAYQLVQDQYSWDAIASDTYAVYREIMNET